MTPESDLLIEALRTELQEYGSMLNLFDEQQSAILLRDPSKVIALHDSIAIQMEAIHFCRKKRESLVEEAALLLDYPDKTSLRKLLPLFPEVMRPLLEALADEITNLMVRTKRRARQNQMLLARSIDVTQKILQNVRPEAFTKTYSRKGQVQMAAVERKTRYEAIG